MIRRSFIYFLHHCRIGDFWTFISISHIINSRFVPFLAKWLTPTRHASTTFLGQIRQTSKSGLIRKFGFEYRITLCRKIRVGEGLRSLSALVADAVYLKLSKLVHACRNYRLPKLACFFETQRSCQQRIAVAVDVFQIGRVDVDVTHLLSHLLLLKPNGGSFTHSDGVPFDVCRSQHNDLPVRRIKTNNKDDRYRLQSIRMTS